MLGRFIAPAGRLAEIGAAAAAQLDAGSPWRFSVLVGARDGADAALSSLAEQAAQIADFEAEYPGRVRVECLEAAIPRDGAARASEFIPTLLDRLRDTGLGRRDLFLEILPGGDDTAVLAAVAAAAPAATAGANGLRLVGAKLRCGGVTADAFPSCERIARVIQTCARQDLPLKCTAGLHHPLRHRAAEPDVMMHGFLNVFGAGLLAWALQPPMDVLVDCVAVTWRDHRVDIETMQRIRRRSLFGFGSCSFAEPRADLQDLGIL